MASWWARLMDDEDSPAMTLIPFTLPPQDRADVAKVRISEREATKRKRIEEQENTRRELGRSEVNQVRRMLSLIYYIVLVGVAGGQSCAAIGAWKEVHLREIAAAIHPDPAPPVAPTPPPPARGRPKLVRDGLRGSGTPQRRGGLDIACR